MRDDDDHTHGDRNYRRSRPFGSTKRSHERDGGGLIDRIVSDISSWFDDDERSVRHRGGNEDTTGRRPPGRQSRHDARSQDYTDDVGDAGGSAFEQREGAAASGAASDRDTDDYADESRVGSQRGKGPKGYRRSDKRITELVNDALHDDDRVDAGEIEVSVAQGEVTLSGSVGSRRDKHRAENVAARVSGVHDVDNRLRVRRNDGAAAAGGLPGDSERDADDYGHSA